MKVRLRQAAAFIASVSKVASFALLISISTAAWHVFAAAAACTYG